MSAHPLRGRLQALAARPLATILPRARLEAFLTPYTPAGERCNADTGCCDFWNRGPDAVRPACCTAHLMEMAVLVSRLLTAAGIRHWLDYGMLLGAVRSGDLIPWDADGDIGILEKDRDRVVALGDQIAAAGHVLDLSHPTIICVRYSARNSTQIDLLPWREQDGMLSADLGWYSWPGMSERESFPAFYVAEPQPITLRGETFPAPTPVRRFLVDHRYGPDCMTPTRPPARRPHAVPEVSEEQLTSGVRGLLDELRSVEREVDALYFGARAGLSPFVEHWIAAGLPSRPRRRRVARRLAGLHPADRNDVSAALLRSLDVLHRAVEEQVHPSRGVTVVRTGRRAERIARAVAPRIRGRLHAARRKPRPGFP